MEKMCDKELARLPANACLREVTKLTAEKEVIRKKLAQLEAGLEQQREELGKIRKELAAKDLVSLRPSRKRSRPSRSGER